ncbi:uncharacterized protein LOC127771841 [Oryza glaberrima]|uniref:uncharacterized protein LOC127771841 n=1 Tax=Oryza glaberrima TaxID=4538 RepID=UPI00224BEA8D|nr:uncharacterized protein LOC127771841 [Oryza glaberrima]
MFPIKRVLATTTSNTMDCLNIPSAENSETTTTKKLDGTCRVLSAVVSSSSSAAAAAGCLELPSTCGCDSAGGGAKRRAPASSSSSSGTKPAGRGGAGGGWQREADGTDWGSDGRTRGRSLLEVVVPGAAVTVAGEGRKKR